MGSLMSARARRRNARAHRSSIVGATVLIAAALILPVNAHTVAAAATPAHPARSEAGLPRARRSRHRHPPELRRERNQPRSPPVGRVRSARRAGARRRRDRAHPRRRAPGGCAALLPRAGCKWPVRRGNERNHQCRRIGRLDRPRRHLRRARNDRAAQRVQAQLRDSVVGLPAARMARTRRGERPSEPARPGRNADVSGLRVPHRHALVHARVRARRASRGARPARTAARRSTCASSAAVVGAMAAIPFVQWVSTKPIAVPLNYDARWVVDSGVRDLFTTTAANGAPRLASTAPGVTAADADTPLNYTNNSAGFAHVAFRDGCDSRGLNCALADFTQKQSGNDDATMESVQVNHPGTHHRKMAAYFDLGGVGVETTAPTATPTAATRPARSTATRARRSSTTARTASRPWRGTCTRRSSISSGGLATPTDYYELFRQAYRPSAPAAVPNSGANPRPGVLRRREVRPAARRAHAQQLVRADDRRGRPVLGGDRPRPVRLGSRGHGDRGRGRATPVRRPARSDRPRSRRTTSPARRRRTVASRWPRSTR